MINGMLENARQWMMVNGIDVIELVALAIIVSIGLKMFLFYDKKKDLKIIYTTIVCYTIIKLFWRVVIHV